MLPKSDSNEFGQGKRSRRADLRVARLVCPPNPRSQVLTPVVTPNSILFSLPPDRDDLCFVFEMAISHPIDVFMRGGVNTDLVTFNLNGAIASSVRLPVNIKSAVVNGRNWVQFAPNSGPVARNVELCFDIEEDVEMIARKVIGFDTNEMVKTDKCMHEDGFKLRSFIRSAIMTQRWSCPICGAEVDIESLRTVSEIEDELETVFGLYD